MDKNLLNVTGGQPGSSREVNINFYTSLAVNLFFSQTLSNWKKDD